MGSRKVVVTGGAGFTGFDLGGGACETTASLKYQDCSPNKFIHEPSPLMFKGILIWVRERLLSRAEPGL